MYKVQKENSSFLTEAYQAYRNFMLSITRKYLGDTTASEDVFHNAFIYLIRNEERLQQLPPGKVESVYFVGYKTRQH